MIVLSFDIATKTGYAVGSECGIEESGSFSCSKLSHAYKRFSELINIWRPDIIITAKPNNRYNVIRKLSEITGVMLLVAERYRVKVEKNLVDKACKKAIIGNGNATKEDVKKKYKSLDEDAADAMMFFDYYILKHGRKKDL